MKTKHETADLADDFEGYRAGLIMMVDSKRKNESLGAVRRARYRSKGSNMISESFRTGAGVFHR